MPLQNRTSRRALLPHSGTSKRRSRESETRLLRWADESGFPHFPSRPDDQPYCGQGDADKIVLGRGTWTHLQLLCPIWQNTITRFRRCGPAATDATETTGVIWLSWPQRHRSGKAHPAAGIKRASNCALSEFNCGPRTSCSQVVRSDIDHTQDQAGDTMGT